MARCKPCLIALALAMNLTMTAAANAGLLYSDAVLADNPVGYWRFEETSGSTAADSANGGGAQQGAQDGTYVGGVTLGETSAFSSLGNAARFDGINDYVTLGNPAPLIITGDLTIEGWHLVTNSPTQGRLAIVDATGTGELFSTNVLYQLHHPPDGLYFALHEYGAGLNELTQTDPATAPLGTWAHFALVRDVSANTWQFYVNGAPLAGTHSFTNDPAGDGSHPSFDVSIGRRGGFNTGFFNGHLDEIAIYDKALTQSQIETHYNAAVPEPTSFVLCALIVAVLACGWFYKRLRKHLIATA